MWCGGGTWECGGCGAKVEQCGAKVGQCGAHTHAEGQVAKLRCVSMGCGSGHGAAGQGPALW